MARGAAFGLAVTLGIVGCGGHGSDSGVASGQAETVVQRAIDDTYRRYPGCEAGSKPVPGTRRIVGGAPDRSLTARFAVLRRPQRRTERHALDTPVARRYFPPGGDLLYASATRYATAADGTRFVVTIARSIPTLGQTARPQSSCVALRRRRLQTLLASRPASVRREADRLEKAFDRLATWRPPPRYALGVSPRTGRPPSAGGPVDAGTLVRSGVYAAYRRHRRGGVFGLVPDGVARVTARFGSRSLDARVHDNVFSVVADDLGPASWPDRLEWRDAGGATVQAMTPPAPVRGDFRHPR